MNIDQCLDNMDDEQILEQFSKYKRSKARGNKASKKKNGMKVTNRSVFLLHELERKRNEELAKSLDNDAKK